MKSITATLLLLVSVLLSGCAYNEQPSTPPGAYSPGQIQALQVQRLSGTQQRLAVCLTRQINQFLTNSKPSDTYYYSLVSPEKTCLGESMVIDNEMQQEIVSALTRLYTDSGWVAVVSFEQSTATEFKLYVRATLKVPATTIH